MLNRDRSWIYGLKAGYDSLLLISGDADTGVNVTNKKTVGFQQIALNVEVVSNGWSFNGYGLISVGDVEKKLNSVYDSAALNTHGLDAGHFISKALHATVGYCYQNGDPEILRVLGCLVASLVNIVHGLITGIDGFYDDSFETRNSADLIVRFGVTSTSAGRKEFWRLP